MVTVHYSLWAKYTQLWPLNEHQKKKKKNRYCNNTTRELVHSRRRVQKHYKPHPLVPLSVMRMNFDSPPNLPRLCWLSAVLQTCQLSHFLRDCPTCWACKRKKEGQSHFLEISVMANFTVWTTENDVNFTWNFFTSAFSLVYYDKLNYEKPSSPEPQLNGFFPGS